MSDVARLAGVSHQTVSRVINGASSIRPETRARVEHAIAQLGYRPNSVARALVTNRSGIIGIIGSSTGQYGPSSIQRSVEESARAAGFFSSSVTLAAVTRQEDPGCPRSSLAIGGRGNRDDRRSAGRAERRLCRGFRRTRHRRGG
ncbi:LacI family DNA-binding transcriptional regulator [Mycolicibacterium sp. PDY-3]|uniref:LacI family DNA-binding transcriptional regulator n=1 Tax=Mycolicibacterium sp. PDY-3 TaxID=3376069 RepID=UPI003788EEB0